MVVIGPRVNIVVRDIIINSSKDFIEFRDIIRFIQNNFLKLFTKHIGQKFMLGLSFILNNFVISFSFSTNSRDDSYFIPFFLFLLTFTFFLPHTYLLLLTQLFNKYPLFCNMSQTFYKSLEQG